jgi:hypothetical protein
VGRQSRREGGPASAADGPHRAAAHLRDGGGDVRKLFREMKRGLGGCGVRDSHGAQCTRRYEGSGKRAREELAQT